MDPERRGNSVPVHVPLSVISALPAEGAGERTQTSRQRQIDIKDGEYSVCFERMGMGDLEVLDVVDVAEEAQATPRAVARAQTAQTAWQRGPEPCQQAAARPVMPSHPFATSYCFAECVPDDSDSDSDDDGGLLDAVEVLVHTEPPDDGVIVAAPTTTRTPTPTPAAILARSKLSIVNNVAVINFPGGGQKQGHLLGADNTPVRFVDVEDEDLDEDELSRKAPTPDNTPERSPSEENQAAHRSRVGLEPGSQLLSALTGMVMARDSECYTGSSTPTPECTPGSTPTGTLSGQGHGQASSTIGTLGRVWSRIMGRAGHKPQSSASAPYPQVCLTPPRRPSSSDDDDEYLVDSEDHRLDMDSHVIDDLEATLEEVRLDGEADDPVVSYLVEEADDAVRSPGAPGDVTVEEVHDDDDDNETFQEVEQAADVEFRTCSSPTAKPSGLLSRLFSRSRTSTAQEATSNEPARRATAKRGKTEASSRDRLLLHRMKPRQPNKAVMRGVLGAHGGHGHAHGALPRILSRWLRQGESGGGGAEGDAGEVVTGGMGMGVALVGRGRAVPSVPPPAQPIALYPPQPLSLQRPRRNHLASGKDVCTGKGIDEGMLAGGKHHEVRTAGEKEWAELGIQTDLTLLTFVGATDKPLEVRNESRALSNSPLSDVTDCV